jgi:hypothetical protein
MSIAEFACVVHFHFGAADAPHGASAGDRQSEQVAVPVVTSVIIAVLELSSGSIVPPPFQFDITNEPNSASIHEALEEAEQFIDDNLRALGRRFAVVMDTSALDMVIAECERQDASIPTFFSVAHDAVAAAKSVHPFDSDAVGDALAACGIPLSDGASTEAPCVHLAQLCKFAVDRGHRFPAALIRKANSKKINKRAASSTQDVASKAHAPDSKGSPGALVSSDADAAAAMLPMTPYCRFRGLPYSATKADIVAFCEDIPMDEQHVHIVLAPGGRPSGDAL